VSGRFSLLREALHAGDGTAARVALAEVSPVEDALDVLALCARDGSQPAIELLIETLDETGVVRAFAGAALLDAAAVDDVSQDALISVAESIHRFSGQAKVTTWVHRIVRNRVVDHLRRQRATEPLPADDLGPGHRMSSMLATRATVREALETLPDLYREPVVLRDLESLPYQEIADRLGRPLGTVKAQIARGRALVAAALAEPETGG